MSSNRRLTLPLRKRNVMVYRMDLSVTEAWNPAMRTRSCKCYMFISNFTSAHACFQNRECVTTDTVAPTPHQDAGQRGVYRYQVL